MSAFFNNAACCCSRSTLYRHKGHDAYRKNERMTRRPRNEDSLYAFPSSSCRMKSGASSPMSSNLGSLSSPVDELFDLLRDCFNFATALVDMMVIIGYCRVLRLSTIHHIV